jgi:hypothetical protein
MNILELSNTTHDPICFDVSLLVLNISMTSEKCHRDMRHINMQQFEMQHKSPGTVDRVTFHIFYVLKRGLMCGS